jgi:hypothetical protein
MPMELKCLRSQCKVHRKVKFSIWLCSGVLLCTGVLFVLVAMDLSRVADDPRLLVTFPYRIRSHALLEESDDRRRLGYDVFEDAQGEALEGMGVLFRKGTRAMPELVVAHLTETTTSEDLRFFLRGLHRSGMPARADVVLLYPWRPLPVELAAVIRDEEVSFQKLLARFRKTRGDSAKLSVFNPGAYMRTMPVSDYGKRQDSMWGKGMVGDDESESAEKVHYGAVVGFDVQELDPDDALSGFLDSPPASLLGVLPDADRHGAPPVPPRPAHGSHGRLHPERHALAAAEERLQPASLLHRPAMERRHPKRLREEILELAGGRGEGAEGGQHERDRGRYSADPQRGHGDGD